LRWIADYANDHSIVSEKLKLYGLSERQPMRDGSKETGVVHRGKILAFARRLDALVFRIDPGRSSQEKALRGRKTIVVKKNCVWAVR